MTASHAFADWPLRAAHEPSRQHLTSHYLLAAQSPSSMRTAGVHQCGALAWHALDLASGSAGAILLDSAESEYQKAHEAFMGSDAVGALKSLGQFGFVLPNCAFSAPDASAYQDGIILVRMRRRHVVDDVGGSKFADREIATGVKPHFDASDVLHPGEVDQAISRQISSYSQFQVAKHDRSAQHGESSPLGRRA